MSSASGDENLSDISLDEEDEALIWKVFYSKNEDVHTSIDERIQHERENESESESMSNFSDIEDDDLVSRYKELKYNKIDNLNEEEKNQLLVSQFTNEQMDRFESYRRMKLNKPGIKKVCSTELGHSVPQNLSIALAGLGKLLLGEVITKAFEVQEKEDKRQLVFDIERKKKYKKNLTQKTAPIDGVNWDQTKLNYGGDYRKPLQSKHIREAWRLLNLEGSNLGAPWTQNANKSLQKE